MAEFFDDEWIAIAASAGSGLPAIDGVSFSFDIEVAETAHGKVRAHGQVVDGRLASFTPGKYVGEKRGDKPDVSFGGKAKRLLPIVTGEQPALVSYMLGELKIEGAYERVVDAFANRCDRSAMETFRSEVAAATD